MPRRVVVPAAAIAILLLALLPLLWVYLLPWVDAGGGGAFLRALQEPLRWTLAARSLAVAGLAATAATAIGLAVGLAPSLPAGRPRTVWAALALLPLALPPYVSAVGWIGLCSGEGGIGRILSWLGFGPPDVFLRSVVGCAWVHALAFWPCVALLVRAARLALDPAVEEAARLHLSPGRAWRRVLLPAVAREARAGAAIVFVLSLADFSVPSVLQVNVFALEVFTRFEQNYDHVAAAALSFPVLIAVAVAIFLERRWAGVADRAFSPQARPFDSPASGRAWIALGLPLTLAVGIPVLQLLVDAGAPDAYVRVLLVAGRPLGNTLLLGFAGALWVGLAGLVLALLVRGGARWLEGPATAALAASFALPAALVGIGLALVWNRPGLPGLVYGSPAILLLAYLARFLLVPFRLVCGGLASDELGAALDAARLHGLPPAVTLFRVVLPSLTEHLRAASLALYVFIVGELATVVLVQPPGWDTVPVRIFQLVHYGYEREVAALCVVLLVAVVVPVAVAWTAFDSARLHPRKAL